MLISLDGLEVKHINIILKDNVLKHVTALVILVLDVHYGMEDTV